LPSNDADQDVRIDSKAEQVHLAQIVRNVPFRVRVRLSRKRNDDEDAKERYIAFDILLLYNIYAALHVGCNMWSERTRAYKPKMSMNKALLMFA
jgi:hypothetical protein